MHFTDYGLDERLVDAVSALGFDAPTPIQAATLPPLLAGKDLLGRARTGSGKTAAFGLPLLHAVRDGGQHVRALVLTPTRELALQVTRALRSFAGSLPVRVVCVYGGASYETQIEALRKGAQVVVGTPGRTLDLADRGILPLDRVEQFVLDEADEMLNMGFLEDVERIMAQLPPTRQTALFSATVPEAIRKVTRTYLNDPVELNVETGEHSVDHIQQRWMRVPHRNKIDALVRVLSAEAMGTTLVFARTRAGCAEVADALAERGLAVDALHGDLSQPARERVLSRLRSRSLSMLVATDVAARGIDVAHITHVINVDLPDDAESYTHRIGRTGRAGREGTAITFVAPSEIGRFKDMQRILKIRVPEIPAPTDAVIRQSQRDGLVAAVKEALDDDLDLELALLGELDDAPPRRVAAAALRLVALARGIALADAAEDDDAPPTWATPRNDRPPRNEQERVPLPEGHVQLFLPIGKQHGVRPGDLVGALANEAGISGDDVGRIEIKDRVSFVAMHQRAADRVLAKLQQLQIRGRPTAVLLARPQDERADQGPPPGRKGPPRGKWKPKGFKRRS